MTRQERENKTIAALTTTGVNLLLLLLLFFAGGWGFSGEGIGDGEYPGIEVNLGYDDQGTGDIEPMTEVGDPEATDDEDPPAQPVEDEVTQPATSEPEPTTQSEVAKTPETEMLTDPKSDVEIKEVKKEEKPVEKTTEKKPEQKVEKPVEKKPEEKKPEEKKPVEKPKAVYQGKTSSTTGDGNGDGKQGTPGNQGDDVGKEGNKGVPGGTPGAAVYKGKPGGGGDGGFGLQLAGWGWDELPKQPKLQETNVRGRIVFEIEVDENGEITSIKTLENQLSPAAERLCRQEIEKHSLVKTSSGQAPERTRGKITFNLDLQ
jgi:outer membrane biosynthesis protein TonB